MIVKRRGAACKSRHSQLLKKPIKGGRRRCAAKRDFPYRFEAHPKASFCLQLSLILQWPNDPRRFDDVTTDPVVLSTLPLRHSGTDGSAERRAGAGTPRDHKPKAFLTASPSATVPNLQACDLNLDESLDIMLWSLGKVIRMGC